MMLIFPGLYIIKSTTLLKRVFKYIFHKMVIEYFLNYWEDVYNISKKVVLFAVDTAAY